MHSAINKSTIPEIRVLQHLSEIQFPTGHIYWTHNHDFILVALDVCNSVLHQLVFTSFASKRQEIFHQRK